jgi:hypothetical protein
MRRARAFLTAALGGLLLVAVLATVGCGGGGHGGHGGRGHHMSYDGGRDSYPVYSGGHFASGGDGGGGGRLADRDDGWRHR